MHGLLVSEKVRIVWKKQVLSVRVWSHQWLDKLNCCWRTIVLIAFRHEIRFSTNLRAEFYSGLIWKRNALFVFVYIYILEHAIKIDPTIKSYFSSPSLQKTSGQERGSFSTARKGMRMRKGLPLNWLELASSSKNLGEGMRGNSDPIGNDLFVIASQFFSSSLCQSRWSDLSFDLYDIPHVISFLQEQSVKRNSTASYYTNFLENATLKQKLVMLHYLYPIPSLNPINFRIEILIILLPLETITFPY